MRAHRDTRREDGATALSRRAFLAGCAVTAASLLAGGCSSGSAPRLSLAQTALSTDVLDGFALASSHEDVRACVQAALDEALASVQAGAGANDAYPACAATLLADAVADAAQIDEYESVSALYRSCAGEFDLAAALDPQTPAAFEPSDALMAASEDGAWLYACDDTTFYVIEAAEEGTCKASAYTLSAEDELERWERTCGVFASGSCVAVVGQLAADTYYRADAADYALAAYEAPRAAIAFLDVSYPAGVAYLGCLGLTGSVQRALCDADGTLLVVTSAPLVPCATADGLLDDALDAEALAEALSALELRAADAFSHTPALYADGSLEALEPARVYVPQGGQALAAHAFAAFDVAACTCVSACAVCSPAGSAPALVCADDALLLSWDEAAALDTSGICVESGLVARVERAARLSGMSCVRLEGTTASALSGEALAGLLAPAASGGYVRLARTSLAFADGTLSARWQLQELDAELACSVVAECGEDGPVLSCAQLGDVACIVAGAERPLVSAYDLSVSSGERAAVQHDASLWPAELAACGDDGRYLAYGQLLARLAADEAAAALLGDGLAQADAASAQALRLLEVADAEGLAFSEAPACSDALASALAACELDERPVLAGLSAGGDAGAVALALAPSGADACVSLLSVAADGLAEVGTVTLQPTAADAADDDAQVSYEDVAVTCSEGIVYAFACGGDVLASVCAIDADEATVLASVALAEQTQLAGS